MIPQGDTLYNLRRDLVTLAQALEWIHTCEPNIIEQAEERFGISLVPLVLPSEKENDDEQ